MITLAIDVLGHDQHVLGAKLYANTASLAPFFDNVDGAMGYLNAVAVERLTPKGHGPSSTPL
jgi:hypothetical protein